MTKAFSAHHTALLCAEPGTAPRRFIVDDNFPLGTWTPAMAHHKRGVRAPNSAPA